MTNSSKTNFIYILYNENKIEIDYKANPSASKIWFLSWIVLDFLNFFSHEELCSIFPYQDILLPLPFNWSELKVSFLYRMFLCSKISYIIGAARYYFVSYSSVVNILTFVKWIVTELYFSWGFSNVDTLPL